MLIPKYKIDNNPDEISKNLSIVKASLIGVDTLGYKYDTTNKLKVTWLCKTLSDGFICVSAIYCADNEEDELFIANSKLIDKNNVSLRNKITTMLLVNDLPHYATDMNFTITEDGTFPVYIIGANVDSENNDLCKLHLAVNVFSGMAMIHQTIAEADPRFESDLNFALADAGSPVLNSVIDVVQKATVYSIGYVDPHSVDVEIKTECPDGTTRFFSTRMHVDKRIGRGRRSIINKELGFKESDTGINFRAQYMFKFTDGEYDYNMLSVAGKDNNGVDINVLFMFPLDVLQYINNEVIRIVFDK